MAAGDIVFRVIDTSTTMKREYLAIETADEGTTVPVFTVDNRLEGSTPNTVTVPVTGAVDASGSTTNTVVISVGLSEVQGACGTRGIDATQAALYAADNGLSDQGYRLYVTITGF